jgi:tRNA threonylcarbamoyladenosine biosynthesis protein TsaB
MDRGEKGVMASSGLRLLLLETSGRTGFVAVAEGPDLRGVRQLEEPRRQGRDLAPAVAELLRGQGWRPRDVHAVIVSRGPGSYTGLRVGIMSAKAFGFATGCTVVAVDTFLVVAHQAAPEVQILDVLADAQQDKVYVQPFERSPEGWKALAPLAIRPFAEWLAGRDARAWIGGAGLSRWLDRLPADTLILDPENREPRPEGLLRVGLAGDLAGERTDLEALEPLYLRPSSAEEQWAVRTSQPRK